jgi:hypothetical protein
LAKRALCFIAALLSPLSSFSAQAVQADQAIAEAPALSEETGGAMVHRLSGFRFPVELAGLPRVGAQVLAPDDIMVRYGAAGPDDGEPWLDLIIYPASQSIDDEATGVAKLIVERWNGKTVDFGRPLPPAASDGRQQWYDGRLEDFEATTGYVLVQRSSWFIKIRATNPKTVGRQGVDKLLDAIAAVRWNWTPPAAVAETGIRKTPRG